MNAEELVKKILRKRGYSNVSVATRMDELNTDSLTLMEMAMELEDALGVSVSDEQMEGVKTVGDFIALVEGCMGTDAAGNEGNAVKT